MDFNLSLSHSIKACQQLTALSNSNFAAAFALLPSGKRQAMEILYAYTRFSDDLVDLPDFDPVTGQEIQVSVRRKKQKLNQWVSALEAALGKIGEQGEIADSRDESAFQAIAQRFPACGGLVFLPALKMIVDRYNIPREPLFHLIDGIESDIEPKPFQAFDDCADYCHQVATSVGFASLAIWGTSQPLFSDEIVRAAKACGVAFQWTNILRDLLEDHINGRVYLPVEEITRYGLTVNQFGAVLHRKEWDAAKIPPKDLSQNQLSAFHHGTGEMEQLEEKFLKLLHYELNRCEVYYERSMPLFRFIHPDSRRMFGLMWNKYYMLYRKMAHNPWSVPLGHRIRLTSLQKMKLLFRWRFLPCFKLK